MQVNLVRIKEQLLLNPVGVQELLRISHSNLRAFLHHIPQLPRNLNPPGLFLLKTRPRRLYI